MTTLTGITARSAGIYLPAHGFTISLHDYLRTLRRVRAAAPGTVYDHSFESPRGTGGATRERILREWSNAMHRRINRHIPGYGAGRKWSADWEHDARRIARRMRERIYTRERECPAEFRARLAHRLYSDTE